MTRSKMEEIEDYLQFFETKSGNPVFQSMFDETKMANMDAYGTILSYTGFLEAFDAAPYTRDEWLEVADLWLENDCAGKPLKIIALFLKRPETFN